MPFTPAHVMAVLPGVRWHARLRLDPTCLVIGSMAPDFEYFVRGEQVSRISHTVLGIATWNIPATLILAGLWHVLVKPHLLAVMPARLERRVAPLIARPWRPHWTVAAVLVVMISAVLGTLTHLVWDGVTHATGVGPRWIPALTTVYELPVVGAMAVHRIVQHASTIVGLVVVGVYVALALRRAHPVEVPPRPRAVIRLVLLACVTVALVLMAVRLHRKHIADPGSLISGGIGAVLAGTIAASLLTWRRVRGTLPEA